MDCTVFALAVESDEAAAAVGASKEHVALVRMFFSATVKDAKRYLSSDPAPAGDEEEADLSDDESA